MSALGDYIHYKSENYQLYGTNKRQVGLKNAYSGSLAGWRSKRMAGYQGTNFNPLKRELLKNTIKQMQMDERLLNLDYGLRRTQFENIVLKRIEQGGKTPEYSQPIKTNKTPNELLARKQGFLDLQKEIDYINSKGPAIGKTTSEDEIASIVAKYMQLNDPNGGRISILGNIQQGFNDYAAKTWRETLDTKLGKTIDNTIKTSAEQALNKAIEQEMLTGITGIVQIKKGEKSTTVETIVDKTNSLYHINATENGWAFEFEPNRENMLNNAVKELSKIYNSEITKPSVYIEGKEIKLGKVLQIVQSENEFGTHWLNMHISNRSYNTADIDKDLALTTAFLSLSQGKSSKETDGNYIFIDRNTGIIHYLGFWAMIGRRKDDSLRGQISRQTFDNVWVGKENNYGMAFKRIASILSESHTIQLKAAYEKVDNTHFGTK